jgi:outer membrane receptor protein involved in Fe transport
MFAMLCVITLHAQVPGGGAPGGRRGNGGNMNMGHLYGKIVDSKTNKGIDAATVQLVGSKFDTTTKKAKDVVLATVLTQSNGDFSLENLPVFGKFKLRATVLGYKDYDAPVSFDLKMPQGGTGSQDRMQQIMNMIDKDLGNIKLEQSDANLGNVTVTATSKPFFEMGVDRKVFNVDKNLVSAGQTATEVMKQIPSVNVDIDGNVTLRNAAPTLFVDGRPTTLTMDQIPADIIDRVELITNPGAKYDASSGGGGILNIVLKKNIKRGYNGGIRAGVDSRGKLNLGGDFNYRQGKINTFLSGNYNQRKSKFTTLTDRDNLLTPPSSIHQDLRGVNNGEFAFLRGGFDYFMDNRNTLTVSGSYVHGSFKNDQPSVIDSTIDNVFSSYTNQNSFSKFGFNNWGGQLSFKHNFAGNGHDITADVNYNSSTNNNNSTVGTNVFYPSGDPKLARSQRTDGSGYNKFLTIQSDYENQLTENTKLEAGVRGAIRNFRNDNLQYLDDSLREDLSSHYKYTDQVYAAYLTYSFKVGSKWNYQLGLRAESSNYKGTLIGGSSTHQDTSFKVNYPVALFPSVYITYKLNEKEDFQINYSRKVNRPGFFQLLPVVNVSDPLNPSQGNPGLKPEFTNAFELSYNKNYSRGANFLATAFFRHTNNLLTNFLVLGPNPIDPKADSVYYSTYANANSSITYGLELTNKLTLMRFWDLTVNVNLFNSKINTNNLKDAGTSNQRLSWFGKINNSFKLPHGFSIQLSGDYQAKTVLPQNSNGNGGGGRGGGGGGGGMFGGSNFGTAQGYIKPRYSIDAAIRKEWTWKGGNSAAISLSMNDVFRTQLYSTYSESTFLIQNQQRRRDPQLLRLNFSYRFGKFDASLFKRKNNKADQSGGMDMMGSGG